jgi:hypothetical protein
MIFTINKADLGFFGLTKIKEFSANKECKILIIV